MHLKLLLLPVVLGQVTLCLTLFVPVSVAEVEKADVIYTLFTNSFPSIGKILTEETSDSLIKDKYVPTVLIIPGWPIEDTSLWYIPLRDEYLKQGLYNIIFLDWSRAGNKSYEIACANVKPVGKYIGQFLVASKVDLEKVHLIGHSLGSHIASFAGQSVKELTGKKVGRITGLDPAGPMFDSPNILETERLNWRDADFVDVIHTDMQHFGFTKPVGHVDFYPNKGKNQPGCPSLREDNNCSHARSTLFFIESVCTKVFAKESVFNEDDKFVVTITPKENGKEVIFGQHVDREVRGVYYLKTNSAKPYLLSNKV